MIKELIDLAEYTVEKESLSLLQSLNTVEAIIFRVLDEVGRAVQQGRTVDEAKVLLHLLVEVRASRTGKTVEQALFDVMANKLIDDDRE